MVNAVPYERLEILCVSQAELSISGKAELGKWLCMICGFICNRKSKHFRLKLAMRLVLVVMMTYVRVADRLEAKSFQYH